MACDLINAWKSADTCKLTMAGTGDQMYLFDKKAWLKRIAEAKNARTSGITMSSLPTPGKGGWYGKNAEGAEDAEAVAKMQLLKGYLVGVDIKTDSGEVTGTKDEGSQASSQAVSFVVDDNIEDFNETAHAMRFTDFGAFVPRANGGYYVVLSAFKSARFSNSFTTGTTYDSDHGHTVTVTAAPTDYDVCFWDPGEDLYTWCKGVDQTTVSPEARFRTDE